MCTPVFNKCTALLGFVCKILLQILPSFLLFQVNFNLQKTSGEVNSVYFLSLVLLDCFLGFRHFYLLLFKFNNQLHSLPLVYFKKINLLARGPRYRKKPSARAANQIAGNHKITLVVHK